jgi:hypothetical protein
MASMTVLCILSFNPCISMSVGSFVQKLRVNGLLQRVHRPILAENRWIIRYIVRSLQDARDSRACDDPKRNVSNSDTEQV